MVKITLKIDGMMCGMCEAHVNDAMREAFKIKKVTSSHTSGETVIIADSAIEEDKLREVVGKVGYEVKNIKTEPYEKHGLLSHFGK